MKKEITKKVAKKIFAIMLIAILVITFVVSVRESSLNRQIERVERRLIEDKAEIETFTEAYVLEVKTFIIFVEDENETEKLEEQNKELHRAYLKLGLNDMNKDRQMIQERIRKICEKEAGIPKEVKDNLEFINEQIELGQRRYKIQLNKFDELCDKKLIDIKAYYKFCHFFSEIRSNMYCNLVDFMRKFKFSAETIDEVTSTIFPEPESHYHDHFE